MVNQIQPDSSYFTTPELTHRIELISHLIEHSNHLVVVKGEHKSGKTFLFDKISQQDNKNLIIRKITANTNISSNDIFKAIIEDKNQDELQDTLYDQATLNHWLEFYRNKQQIPVLLIDNVDLFNDELINILFDLLINANLTAALHICLFCEPIFLNQLENSSINYDDTQSLHIIEIPKLSEKQTEHYIHHKYSKSGVINLNFFNDKIIKKIHQVSHGMPGRINDLCEQYLKDFEKRAVLKEEKLTLFNIKIFPLRKKLILIIGSFIFISFIGVALLFFYIDHDEEIKETQTIKLKLPDLNKKNDDQIEIVNIKPPSIPKFAHKEESVSINDPLALVVPEMVSDFKNNEVETVRNIERQIGTKKIDFIEEVTAKKTKNIIIESESVTETGKSREAIIEPTTVEGVKHSTLIVHDLDWLVKQDPNKYVLQLIGAYEKKTINLFLKLFKNNDDQIIPFNTLNKGKKWHVLFYGLYENRDAAIAAIEKLPTEAKLVSPWPRTIGSIKNRLK